MALTWLAASIRLILLDIHKVVTFSCIVTQECLYFYCCIRMAYVSLKHLKAAYFLYNEMLYQTFKA